MGAQAIGWEKVTLGRTGLQVSQLGLSAGYGASGADVEHAFERGINYFYWGSLRRKDFGRGLRTLAQRDREKMVLLVQSYTRVGGLMRGSLERALRAVGTDYADLLLLGWWNAMPPPRIMDAALALREAGRVKHLMISCHHRPSFVDYAADERIGAIMVRYNAAHTGAEQEVFPHLSARPPGVAAYTATRWGHLINPKKTPAGEKTPRASDCYRFALSHDAVDLCTIGPKNRAHLDEALSALDRGPMDADERAWMRRVGAGVRAASLRGGKAA